MGPFKAGLPCPDWTYSLGVSAMHTNGFPQYGYRVNGPLTIGDGVTPLPPLPSSAPSDKGAVDGRFTYTVSPTASVDLGFEVFGNGLTFANPYALIPADVFSPINWSTVWLPSGFVRTNVSAFDGMLQNHLTFFSNATINTVQQTEACFNAEFISFNCTTGFHGARWGVEYQRRSLASSIRLAHLWGAHHDRVCGHVTIAQSRRWIVRAD